MTERDDGAWAEICATQAERADRAERERDEAMKGLWDAYVATGSDPDGDNRWHAPPADAARYTVLAVEELRRDYDDAWLGPETP